jgi:TRAP-type mannitol/chloroaromatic compound transport system permease small subunit
MKNLPLSRVLWKGEGYYVMNNLLKIIDSTSKRVGQVMGCIAIIIVCLGAFEVVMRYGFNNPTNWGYDTLLMAGASMYVLSWAYVHLEHGHIRLDLFYIRFSTKVKAIVDVICTLLFFFPLISFLIYASALKMWRSWITGEISIETTWYPPLGPLRTAVFIGLCLFALQGIAQFIRDLHILMRHKADV